MLLQLKEVMVRSIGDLELTQKVEQCSPDLSVEEATRKLQKGSGKSIVVLKDKKLVGIFTERDVLNKVTLSTLDPKKTKISALMTPNPVSVKRQATLTEVLSKMRDGKFRHLVVVDAYGNTEGVISMRDIMDYLSNLMMADLSKQAA